MSINNADLDRLEKKYSSPPTLVIVRADDTGPLYLLKRGKKDFDKVMSAHMDLHLLIKSLRLALKLMS